MSEVAVALEIAKMAAQIYYASCRQANLTQEEQDNLLVSERERFKKNISTPLPEV